MSSQTTLRCLEKGPSEQVRVERSTFNGREYVSARIWFRDERGAWHPTKKGLTLSPELAAEVARALLEVAEEADPWALGEG